MPPIDLAHCPWCASEATSVDDAKGYADWGCGSFKHGEEPHQFSAGQCVVNVLEAEVERLRKGWRKANGRIGELLDERLRERQRAERAEEHIREIDKVLEAAHERRDHLRERDIGRVLTERDSLAAEAAALREALAPFALFATDLMERDDYLTPVAERGAQAIVIGAFKEAHRVYHGASPCPAVAVLLAGAKLAEAALAQDDAVAAWRAHLYTDPHKQVYSQEDEAAKRAAHPEWAEWEAEKERLAEQTDALNEPRVAALSAYRDAVAAAGEGTPDA